MTFREEHGTSESGIEDADVHTLWHTGTQHPEP